MVDAIGAGPAFQAFSRPAGPSVDNPSLNDRNATSNGAPVDGPSPSLGGRPPVGLEAAIGVENRTLNDRTATSNGAPVDGPSPSLGGQPPVGLDQQLSLQDVTARGSLVDFAT